MTKIIGKLKPAKAASHARKSVQEQIDEVRSRMEPITLSTIPPQVPKQEADEDDAPEVTPPMRQPESELTEKQTT